MTSNPISNRKLKRLNPRQLKKRGVGQFERNFFEVWVQYTHDLSTDEYQSFLQAYQDKIKAMGLLSIFGNNLKPSSAAGVISVDVAYGSPTEEQKAEIVNWVKTQPNVKSVEAGDII